MKNALQKWTIICDQIIQSPWSYSPPKTFDDLMQSHDLRPFISEDTGLLFPFRVLSEAPGSHEQLSAQVSTQCPVGILNLQAQIIILVFPPHKPFHLHPFSPQPVTSPPFSFLRQKPSSDLASSFNHTWLTQSCFPHLQTVPRI